MHAGSSLKKIIWYQNKAKKSNSGTTGILDNYKIYGESICNPMFWFCLLHKFAPLHTQTDPCTFKCSSGVEGKVQIEKKRKTNTCWLKSSIEVEGVLQIGHSIDAKSVHMMGKLN